MREGFIAAARAHGEGAKTQRVDFFPRRPAESLDIPFDWQHNCVVGNTKDKFHALDSGFKRSTVSQAHEKTVAGLLDALNRDTLQAVAKGREKLAEEKATVAAL